MVIVLTTYVSRGLVKLNLGPTAVQPLMRSKSRTVSESKMFILTSLGGFLLSIR